MIREIVNINFDTKGNNNLGTTDINSVQYVVNWDNILSKKYKRFQVSITFKSSVLTGTFANMGKIGINIGSTSFYDGNIQTNFQTIIVPTTYTYSPAFTYFTTENSEINTFWMKYPSNNIVTIQLQTISNTILLAPTVPANYILQMQIKCLVDEDLQLINKQQI